MPALLDFPMSKIKFERTSAPTGSVEFEKEISHGNQDEPLRFSQPLARAVGGDYYSYNKGGQDRSISFSLTKMTLADRTNLLNFLKTVAVGSVNSFTVTEAMGYQYTCILYPDQDLSFPPSAFNRHTGQLKLKVLSGPE